MILFQLRSYNVVRKTFRTDSVFSPSLSCTFHRSVYRASLRWSRIRGSEIFGEKSFERFIVIKTLSSVLPPFEIAPDRVSCAFPWVWWHPGQIDFRARIPKLRPWIVLPWWVESGWVVGLRLSMYSHPPIRYQMDGPKTLIRLDETLFIVSMWFTTNIIPRIIIFLAPNSANERALSQFWLLFPSSLSQRRFPRPLPSPFDTISPNPWCKEPRRTFRRNAYSWSCKNASKISAAWN